MSCNRRRVEAFVRFVLAVISNAILPAVSGGGEGPPVGCYTFGYKLGPPMSNMTMPIPMIRTPTECQAKCKATAGCTFFDHTFASSECVLGSVASAAGPDSAVVSGPRECDPVPAQCTAELPATWPGKTEVEAISLTTTGIGKPVLQCWPRTADEELAECDAEPIRVLEDVKDGWPAQCHNMEVQAAITTRTACEERCRQNTACPGWILIISNGITSCWHGLGESCYDKLLKANVTAGQRLMRGHVRVLKDLTGIQVMGLTSAFPSVEIPDQTKAVSVCRSTCYSALTCSAWLFSTQYGCYVEDIKHEMVRWPPTTSDFDTSTLLATSTIAGEYIQRLCGSFGKTTMAATSTTTTVTMTTTTTTTTTTTQSTITTATAATASASRAPSVLSPGADALVSFGIQNLDYGKLGAQVDVLSVLYANLIAKALGVTPETNVMSLDGVIGRVSMGPIHTTRRLAAAGGSSDTSVGTKCDGIVSGLQSRMPLNDIVDIVGNDDLESAVVRVTQDVVSASGNDAIVGALSISDVSTRSVYMVSIPTLSTTSTTTTSTQATLSSRERATTIPYATRTISDDLVAQGSRSDAVSRSNSPGPQNTAGTESSTSEDVEADEKKSIGGKYHRWHRVVWLVGPIAICMVIFCCGILACCCRYGFYQSKQNVTKKRGLSLEESGSEDEQELVERDLYRTVPQSEGSMSQRSDYEASTPLFGTPNLRPINLDATFPMPGAAQSFTTPTTINVGVVQGAQAGSFPMQQRWR